MNSRRTVSWSRGADRKIFGALLIILICAAPRLRVYYRSTQVGATRLELAAIDSAGAKTQLAVPQAMQGHRVRATLAGIKAFSNTPEAQTLTPPDGYLEWTMRFTVGAGMWINHRTRVVSVGRIIRE